MTPALRCFVVARPFVLQAATEDSGGAIEDLVRLHALEAEEDLPNDILAPAQCLFLEVAPEAPGSIRRIEAVRRMRPDLPVVAMISTPDFALTRTLIRQGVKDVVSLPLQSADVISILMDIGAQVAANPAKLAPMVVLASPTGGAGATSIITQLGYALTKAAPSKTCCLIDLDVQFGDVANYLGLRPKASIIDLLDAGDRLDSTMISEAAVDSGRGLRVIAAPTEMGPVEDVSVERLQHLLKICRTEFDLVLIDLPSNWTNWVLSVVVASDYQLLVTETSLQSIRRARRCLDLLEANGIEASRTGLVVNRNERRFMREIDVSDVADTLHRSVVGALPLENRQLTQAQDQGLLIHELTRKSHFESACDELAQSLMQTLSGLSQ